ncbi:SAM-dependent methyltransferase [Burkholderia sp. Ax-1719]|uniref:SAM-dependent methyltransferase n=1 Tax=Burkholderia sp. Ax-1719 TaxID=2608334 RepID=UPI001420C472|nr:SAM-dependent methyltransferase [Burkholderia sp. Ax-1719]NIE63342.1 methyltransferase domain-containing protein [Burkholderia sp. Ax-1719]
MAIVSDELSPAIQRAAAQFDAKYADTDDPWRYRTSWYESRKRAMTLAALPRSRYGRAFEPGCANGELSAALATRCDHLLCADFAANAVAIASRRLAEFEHVEVQRMAVPQQWPGGSFDLIVISEFAYYLKKSQCRTLAQQTCASLDANDGAIVCCHWRHGAHDCCLDADSVDQLFSQAARANALHLATRVQDADFLLSVWTTHSAGVAEREPIYSATG